MRNKVGNLRGFFKALAAMSLVFALALVPVSSFAANNSTFNQTVGSGTLSTDILDNSQASVASPSVTMTTKAYSFTCQSGGSASTGTLGSNTQRVYVTNGGSALNGWTLTLAATSGATAQWSNTGATHFIDFNDASGAGCTDGADADSNAGQLSVDPSVGTITNDCTSCSGTGISKGTSSAFSQGSVDSITLLTSTSANQSWRGYLTGVALSQTIPANTPADSYSLNMTLTVTAQ